VSGKRKNGNVRGMVKKLLGRKSKTKKIVDSQEGEQFFWVFGFWPPYLNKDKKSSSEKRTREGGYTVLGKVVIKGSFHRT